MFDRSSINFIQKWWLSIDKTLLFLVVLTLFLGNVFTILASPVVADRIGLSSNLFIVKNIIFSTIGFFIIIFMSLFSEKRIIQISYLSFVILLILMILVLILGSENKGATRWIRIAGFSLQPSEIIKPFFTIIISHILSRGTRKNDLHIFLSFMLFLIVLILLLKQPDIGMIALISCVFFSALFLMGIKIKNFVILASILLTFSIPLYFFFPHFNYRINSYVKSAFLGGEKTYQIEKSLSAFTAGGFLGKGPFEGSIKNHIPDAHTDFIFAVIGEEFGSMMCIILLCIFIFISFRFMLKSVNEFDLFKYLAINCLSLQFLFQALINIGVSLNLLPTKGMTLPLISYGGSSIIGISTTIGILLALTRDNYSRNNLNLRKLIINT